MKHFELYRLNVDKRPRTPARCPFYFLDTERNNTVVVTSIIALVIILGLGFWVSERSKEKVNTEAVQKARDGFMSLVNELEADGISDELVQWLEARVRILKWGKHYKNLLEEYDFQGIITVDEYLKINKIDSLDSSKVYAINKPKGGEIFANLFRGRVICGACNEPMTSMVTNKRNKTTGEKYDYRYYYKCENRYCNLNGKSIRAKTIIDTAEVFFEEYLFIKKSNYLVIKSSAERSMKHESARLTSEVSSLKRKLALKKQQYEQTKALILESPELKDYYNLGKLLDEQKELEQRYELIVSQRRLLKNSLITFDEYLKLFEFFPVIFEKLDDMSELDQLLKLFFSNFIIEPIKKDTFKGSKVSYKLNEPWKGFIESNDFVCGAGKETLTPGLFHGKEAL